MNGDQQDFQVVVACLRATNTALATAVGQQAQGSAGMYLRGCCLCACAEPNAQVTRKACNTSIPLLGRCLKLLARDTRACSERTDQHGVHALIQQHGWQRGGVRQKGCDQCDGSLEQQ